MLEISKDELLRGLKRDNPWWGLGPDGPAPVFGKRRAYFDAFKHLVMQTDIRRSVILLGPRRVGKTVMLHQLIALLQENLPSKQIFFASLDTPLYSSLSL